MTLTLDDPWKFTRPVSFTHPFTDEEIAVERGGWQFVYLEICRALHQRDCGLFHSLLTNPLFLRHIQMGRDGFRNPHPIVDGIFAEMNVSSRGIRARIRKLMQTFSHHAPQFFSAQAVRVDTNGEKQG